MRPGALVVVASLALGACGKSGFDEPVEVGVLDPIELDCGARAPEVVSFGPACQYATMGSTTGEDLPLMICAQAASAVGALRMVVAKPAAVSLGQAIPLGGDDPVVTVDLTALAGSLLIQTVGQQATTGAVVLDQLDLGHSLSGHFVGATVQAQPDPPFPCRFSDAEFSALAPGGG
jgi:hypothetical protein